MSCGKDYHGVAPTNASRSRGKPRRKWRDDLDAHVRYLPVAALNRDEYKMGR